MVCGDPAARFARKAGCAAARLLPPYGLAIVSTGPDRDANIVLQDPFA